MRKPTPRRQRRYYNLRFSIERALAAERPYLLEELWLRGVDLNHRPLGYEPNRANDRITFQRLDGAGNDRQLLKRHQSTTIGLQSDYSPARPVRALKRSLFRAG